VILERLHEGGVLRQEAVARMDRLRPRDLAGRDDRGEVQVALRRGRRADADGLVGHADMHGVGVGGGVDGDGRMPISRQARTTRSAISPRLAIRIFSNIALTR
jgi:hypothetical protein